MSANSFVFEWTPDRREEWQDDSLCATTDPEIFFPEKGDIGNRVNEAKQICAECPVRQQCLDYAIANREEHGIWGGLSYSQRKRLYGPAEKRDYSRLDTQEIRRHYANGLNDVEIAVHLGCSSSAVAKARKRLGLEQHYFQRTEVAS